MILILLFIYALIGATYWSRKEISNKMPRLMLMSMYQRQCYNESSNQWQEFCYKFDKASYEKPQNFVVNIPYFSDFVRQDLIHKLPYDEYILIHEYK